MWTLLLAGTDLIARYGSVYLMFVRSMVKVTARDELSPSMVVKKAAGAGTYRVLSNQ